MNLNKVSLKKYLELCVIVIMTLTVIVYVNKVARQMFVTGFGKRMGVVYKVTKRGWFAKSWEGEMFVPSEEVNLSGAVNPEIWFFSISDELVVKDLEKTMGRNVILKYNRSFSPFERETLFDVTKVITNDVPQIFIQMQDEMIPYPRFTPNNTNSKH